MYEDKSDGASYLASLKKPSPQAGGAAPGPAPEPTKSLPANLAPSEKRRSRRYRCQGSAHLRNVRGGVATWATFTDISLHGCYVEAMSGFPLGTELALRIEVNGFQVECGGEVRVVYPGLGMGIAFSAMAESPRDRLLELLRSLSQPTGILGQRLPPPPDATPAPATFSAEAALRAITNFFAERQVLSREEFQRILRKAQS
jgi:hypothetical protein